MPQNYTFPVKKEIFMSNDQGDLFRRSDLTATGKMGEPATEQVFHFKRFDIRQTDSSVKVGTDGVLLGAWADLRNAESALDIGTGTGVIAIMLAQRGKALRRIRGVEIDEKAWQTAVYNAAQSPWGDRIRMICQPVQEYAGEEAKGFDLIVSNPPFFRRSTLSSRSSRNRIRHGVSLPYEELLAAVGKLLTPRGRFNLILPVAEGLEFINIARDFGFFLTRKTTVYSVREKAAERFLLELGRYDLPVKKEDVLVIHGAWNEEFTKEYRQLTGDFYLKF